MDKKRVAQGFPAGSVRCAVAAHGDAWQTARSAASPVSDIEFASALYERILDAKSCQDAVDILTQVLRDARRCEGLCEGRCEARRPQALRRLS